MTKPLIYRQNNLFKINIEQLPLSARRSDIINTLYAYLYLEFRGAEYSEKYANMTYVERMEAVNQYAREWLNKKGYK